MAVALLRWPSTLTQLGTFTESVVHHRLRGYQLAPGFASYMFRRFELDRCNWIEVGSSDYCVVLFNLQDEE